MAAVEDHDPDRGGASSEEECAAVVQMVGGVSDDEDSDGEAGREAAVAPPAAPDPVLPAPNQGRGQGHRHRQGCRAAAAAPVAAAGAVGARQGRHDALWAGIGVFLPREVFVFTGQPGPAYEGEWSAASNQASLAQHKRNKLSFFEKLIDSKFREKVVL